MPTRLITNPVYPPESVPFSEIAATIRPRLASYCGINEGWVRPVANDKYEVTVTEQFFLYYQFFGIEAFGDTGGGRLNPWAYRLLRVYVYTRSGVDLYGTDEVALQGVDPDDPDMPVGQFQAEELVIGALFNWMPKNNLNGALCLEPLHPWQGSTPAVRKAEDSEGLIRTNLDFQIKYGLAIDKTDPAI